MKRQNKKINNEIVYGIHAVKSLINYKKRPLLKLMVTKERTAEFSDFEHIIVTRHELDALLPNATHQGVAAETTFLRQPSFEKITQSANKLIILDQLNDPQNIGAIIRSAAAFGYDAVISHEHNAPVMSGTIAKAACGAAEWVPYIHVKNIAKSLDILKDAGFWSIGLAGTAKQTINSLDNFDKHALVVGAEGKGLRDNVAKHCDLLAKIPISNSMESLNAATASAIAMFAIG